MIKSVCLLTLVFVFVFVFDAATPTTAFVVVPPNANANAQKTILSARPATRLYDDRGNHGDYDDTSLMASPSNSAGINTSVEEDVVAHRTSRIMEQEGPADGLAHPHQSQLDDDDTDDDDSFDPAKQIFDPTSFWTERSGRFPRKK